MRIISGTLKGRTIKGYDIVGTRPTMDRIKESIFSIIQSYTKNSVVLDLFAGTGNLGFEAISNGCTKCYFVDKNKECIKFINENIINFNIKDKCITIKDDYNNALKYFANNNIKFDIIFLDPPYKDNVIGNIISYILRNNLLNKQGIIIAEYEINEIEKEYKELAILKEKKYGSKFVTIFKNKI